MLLQFKRIVRTSESEQYSLFDLDDEDKEGMPASVGKIDLHYSADGTYGSLLLWTEYCKDLGEDDLRALVQEVMDEISAPMGVPSEYLIECAFADEQDYKVYTNIPGEVEDDDEDEDESESDE